MKTASAYLGIDVGSVTTKFALLDGSDELVAHLYLPTQGDPVGMVQQGLRRLEKTLSEGIRIGGVAATGSARRLAGIIVGADMVKNEISSHATATLHYLPQARTIIEIGGQDSKIIIIRDGEVTDFGMNTICAAGTGSFLDHQAQRLKMDIMEFSQRAFDSSRPVPIAGRCTVFAESDMIHRQQMGHRIDDIIHGLCQTLARNYIHNLGPGKDIQTPIVFQGGVAFNRAMVRAFQEELDTEIIVPTHHEVMGAIGAALLVHEKMAAVNGTTRFNGFAVSGVEYHTSAAGCDACGSACEIAQLQQGDKVLARWGGRCDLWEEEPANCQVKV